MSMASVKVSNVSLGATEQDLKEFFSFSGDIECVEVKSGDALSQIAYVTFKESQGAETAILLSGATVVDLSVIITLAEEGYQPPLLMTVPDFSPHALKNNEGKSTEGAESAVRKAEDVITTMLAKGFVLGKDVLNKAKLFDEKHQLTSTASAKVASFDQKIGLSEKVSIGTAVVNTKVKEMDEKFHVSDKTKSTIAVAEQKVNGAGSAMVNNRYVTSGISLVAGIFRKVSQAAQSIGFKAKEKIAGVPEEKNSVLDDVSSQAPHMTEDDPKVETLSEQQGAKSITGQDMHT